MVEITAILVKHRGAWGAPCLSLVQFQGCRQCLEALSSSTTVGTATASIHRQNPAPRDGEGALLGPYPALPSAHSATCFCHLLGFTKKGGEWSARLAHKGGAALLKVKWSLAGVDHDSLLIHNLTGGVGEGRQRQRDSLHLPLTHFLIMLFFQVLPPGKKKKNIQPMPPHFGRLRREDHLSPGVRDQLKQNGKTPPLQKIKIHQVWWHTPVVSASWEAEVGESPEPGKSRM
ncbi:hypothetical protein AAY473_004264 [Plecturocebus cupreus]